MEVTWFRHQDEHRNELLRYGLMILANAGSLIYRELPLLEATGAGFSSVVTASSPHHVSILSIEFNGRRVRCAVDSEDSFYWMSSLISEVDLYLCAGYNADFFLGRTFPQPNSWQSDDQISYYRNRATELIEAHGDHFEKARPFVPIGPNLSTREEVNPALQKIRNARHKFGSLMAAGLYWKMDYEAYSRRYSRLLTLRRAPLTYDVVLNDSLWGWPARRIDLHGELNSLKERFVIHAKLNWAPPVSFDASDRLGLNSSDFPRMIGHIADYEAMLASSRLGVFATGFHWGWRSIMTLAMLFGIPILTDRLMLQPWFGLERFDLTYNDQADWSCIASLLGGITEEDWQARRERNVRIYDTFMAPQAVARYVVDEAQRLTSADLGRGLRSS